jgi:quercetin dioxygenase-like cupin family protein
MAHSERVKLRIFSVAAAVTLPLVGTGSAQATPAEGDVVRTDLAKGTTDAPVSIVTPDGVASVLLVQSLLIRPGASSGWHTHPGTEFSAIKAGTVAVQTGPGCGITEYVAGQAVFIPAGVPHRVDNDSAQDAEVIVTYTVAADAPVRGDAPDACAPA